MYSRNVFVMYYSRWHSKHGVSHRLFLIEQRCIKCIGRTMWVGCWPCDQRALVGTDLLILYCQVINVNVSQNQILTGYLPIWFNKSTSILHHDIVASYLLFYKLLATADVIKNLQFTYPIVKSMKPTLWRHSLAKLLELNIVYSYGGIALDIQVKKN